MKGMKSLNKRLFAQIIVVLVVVTGLIWHTGLGTPSSFGWDGLATICPLGWIQSVLSGGAWDLGSAACIAITIALVVLFGKAFCGWLCPTPLIRRVFGGKRALARDVSPRKDECKNGCATCTHTCMAQDMVKRMEQVARQGDGQEHSKRPNTRRRSVLIKSSRKDLRWAVLCAVMVAVVLIGFPVFCLVCPVGLAIGEVIALWRFFALGQMTWTVVVLPAILVVELVVLKRWCHVYCPIAAVVSFASKGNKTFRPVVEARTCLREQGTSPCHACFEACPESIDLHDLSAGAPFNECMKCHACADACPTGSIRFPLHVSKSSMKDGTFVVLPHNEDMQSKTGLAAKALDTKLDASTTSVEGL